MAPVGWIGDRSVSQIREERTARYGWIGESGIVVCGSCVRSLASESHRNVSARIRFLAEGWEPFDDAGEDWCSHCDADLKLRH